MLIKLNVELQFGLFDDRYLNILKHDFLSLIHTGYWLGLENHKLKLIGFFIQKVLFSNNTMENLTTASVLDDSAISNSQMLVVAMICDCSNIGLLIFGIRKMYLAIEIGHPVYATLFCNLASALVSSIVELFVIPFLN